ncbi:MAG: nucleotide exchange factor GrpE [Peptococcaceae bacterium]|nr:nucleotide exchange factor GrpE [Peptococcaceae bacterium]
MGEEVKLNGDAREEARENGPVHENGTGQTDGQAEPAGLAVENQGEDPLKDLQARLEEEKAKAEEYFNRLTRLQADFENFRRRTRQEKEEFARFASEQLVTALLPVLDNFERALASCGHSVEDVKNGVEMIYRQMKEVLAAEGLTVIDAVGESFDPKKHEAVMHEETGEHPDNTVLEEFRRGYCLKDKVIRPAMVKVARN